MCESTRPTSDTIRGRGPADRWGPVGGGGGGCRRGGGGDHSPHGLKPQYHNKTSHLFLYPAFPTALETRGTDFLLEGLGEIILLVVIMMQLSLTPGLPTIILICG